jgi:hypothetical protein
MVPRLLFTDKIASCTVVYLIVQLFLATTALHNHVHIYALD